VPVSFDFSQIRNVSDSPSVPTSAAQAYQMLSIAATALAVAADPGPALADAVAPAPAPAEPTGIPSFIIFSYE
jgi:hypothetical protein